MENNVNEEIEAYKSFVGHPELYDFLGASQFSLLFTLGLQAEHRLLDFGCGSLRAGRFFIPYLNESHYFGIEPNKWLIEEGIRNQVGEDIIRIKKPRFCHNNDFTVGDFSGEEFNFILAQSIFSHSESELLQKCLASFSSVLAPDGFIVATFIDSSTDSLGSEWIYPGIVTFRRSTLKKFAQAAELAAMPLPWYRPFQSWYLFTKDPAHLPSRTMRRYLQGAVLYHPQHLESWRPGGRLVYRLRKAFRRNAPPKLQSQVINWLSKSKKSAG